MRRGDPQSSTNKRDPGDEDSGQPRAKKEANTNMGRLT